MSPAAAGSGLTRSKIETWDITHLEASVARWRASAAEFEELFSQHRQNISGTAWEGTAKDAALDRVTADTAVVGRHGEIVRAAADLADSSVADLRAAQRAALTAIAEAEADGFEVAESLRVTDTRRYDITTIQARNRVLAEHADNIQWNASQLLATDTLIGERLRNKARELDGVTFDGADNGTIQAASFGDGFKQSPGPLDPSLMSRAEALAAWEQLRAAIASHDSRCSVAIVGPLPIPQYNACQAEKAMLEAERAALQARLADFGIYPGYTGDLASVGAQIGAEVAAIPKGTGLSQTQTLAERVTALHLNQADAARVTDIASQRAFGATAGVASLPDGTKIVLPEQIMQGIAMRVHPDGSVTVFRGDLNQFLPYLGR